MRVFLLGLANGSVVRRTIATDNTIEQDLAKYPPTGGAAVHWVEITLKEAKLHDIRYRYAWKLEGNVLGLDLPKARAIRMERLRQERTERFKTLDPEYIIAQQRGNKQWADQAAEKAEKLRAMPELLGPELEKATTADELDAVTLDLLDAMPAPRRSSP